MQTRRQGHGRGGGWQKQRKHARNRKNGNMTGMGRPGAEVGMCVGGRVGGEGRGSVNTEKV